MSEALLPFHPSDEDQHWLQAALTQAALALPHCPPNPAVGCIIVSQPGVAQGHTQPAGQAHAEIMALRAAAAQGIRVVGSTVYVTLEPCVHTGRTGPCVDALLAQKPARVVVALLDPNPLVAGKGVVRLRAAGVDVDILPRTHALALAARDVMAGFLSRMERARPWLRLKVATSLDGQMALKNGQSQWITGAQARADGQSWRMRASCILTGIGTVLADDPLLNVRADSEATTRQPDLCICDSHLRTPLKARLWSVPKRQVLIYCRADADPEKRLALEAQGAQLINGNEAEQSPASWSALFQALHARHYNEVHIECGPRLAGALLQAGLVDELLQYVGPRLLGPGLGLADLPALNDVQNCLRLYDLQCAMLGDSVRIRAWLRSRALQSCSASANAHV